MRTRTHRPADRRGFALAVALFALVVIGALIAGVFFASTQEYRVGRNTMTQQRAFAAAEYGLNDAIRGWDGNALRALGTGRSRTSTFSAAGMTGSVTITRLNANSYWVVSEGVAGTSSATDARRRTSGVVRLQLPMINFLGALTLRGQARIGGSSRITGVDQNPPGWTTCPPTGTAMPGIVVDTATSITYSGNAYSIAGTPPVQYDRTVRDTSTFFDYGESDWNQLIQSATIRFPLPSGASPGSTNLTGIQQDTSVTLPGGGTVRQCDASNPNNWGQVTRSMTSTPGICEGYFPVIYSNGHLSINGGYGQGVLLVDGDLEVQGSFQFFGPVIVRGRLRTSGTGGHFNGGVMAANVDLGANTVLGDAEVIYSRCAVTQALMGVATPVYVRDRAWAELF